MQLCLMFDRQVVDTHSLFGAPYYSDRQGSPARESKQSSLRYPPIIIGPVTSDGWGVPCLSRNRI